MCTNNDKSQPCKPIHIYKENNTKVFKYRYVHVHMHV